MASTSGNQQPTDGSSKNYATVTAANLFPKKENAIVIDSVNQAPTLDFIQVLAQKINPAHIRFVSKISNNRLCVYLATKEVADELVEKHKSITVCRQEFPIRPLISRNKRIILSNVSPSIPHALIENKLYSYGIKTVTPMSFLRAGFSSPNLSHILSFRRQTFISPEDESKLPECFQVIFEEVPHWIYITSDTPTCFQCKQQGHLAKNCPQINPDFVEINPTSNTISQTPIISTPQHVAFHSTTSAPAQVETITVCKEPHIQTPKSVSVPVTSTKAATTDKLTEGQVDKSTPARMKRPLSTTDSIITSVNQLSESDIESTDYNSGSDSEIQNPEEFSTSRKPNAGKNPKKLKIKPDNSQDNLWTDTKALVEKNVTKYPLSFNQLINFFDKTKGTKFTVDIAKDFTNDLSPLIAMLREIYPTLRGKGLKNRCSRIIKKLEASKDTSHELIDHSSSDEP